MAYMPDFGARFDPQGLLGNLAGGAQGLLNMPAPPPSWGVQPMQAGVAMPPDPQQTASVPANPAAAPAPSWASNPIIGALGASLLSTPTLREGLASFGQQAPQLMAEQRRKNATVDWLSKNGAIDPQTRALFMANPQIAEAVAASRLTPGTKKLQFSPMGQGYVFDERTGAMSPVNGNMAGQGGGELPIVNVDARGNRDPAQETQFLQAIGDPALAAEVKGIADYTIDPAKSVALKGGRREYVLGLVQQFDPSYDMTQFGARSAARKYFSGGGAGSQAIQSANTTIGHVADLKKDFAELHNSDYPMVNAIGNPLAIETGHKDIQAAMGRFNTSADAVSSELAKVFKGSGATSEQEILEWRRGLSPNMAPAQFNASVDNLLTHLLKARLDAMRSMYETSMGKPANFKILSDESRAILQNDFGFDPTELDNPGGPMAAGALPADGGAPAPSPGGGRAPPSAAAGGQPPMQGAKQAPDGNWYVADPARPGKYLQVVPDAGGQAPAAGAPPVGAVPAQALGPRGLPLIGRTGNRVISQ